MRKRQHVFSPHYVSFSTPCSCLLRLAVTCLLRARVRDFSAHFAIKCSSLCTTNQGTSKRSPASSTGFTDYPSVSTSNKLLERSGMDQYPVMPSSLYIYIYIYENQKTSSIYRIFHGLYQSYDPSMLAIYSYHVGMAPMPSYHFDQRQICTES